MIMHLHVASFLVLARAIMISKMLGDEGGATDYGSTHVFRKVAKGFWVLEADFWQCHMGYLVI